MSSHGLRVLPPHSDLGTVRAAVSDALAGGTPVAPLPADAAQADQVRAMLAPDRPVTEPDAAVIVSTSGSTGAPKGVVLSRQSITASAEATHRRLGGPGHWLLALPSHYVAGFMVLARAVVADVPVSEVGSDLSGLDRALGRNTERSYLSLVPTQLTRALADQQLTATLQRVDVVLLGGASARPELLRQAADAGITVVTTYGMSETCGGCVYDGVALDGVGIELTDTDPDGVGRVLLGGPSVFSGYRLEPDLTAATLIRSAGGSTDRQVRTNDRGRIVDGRLEILGRFDDVIISGGMKIDLARVERLARDWPALAGGEIAMIGVPDQEWGTRMICYAEGATLGHSEGGDNASPTPAGLSALQDYLTGRLARHEQPRELIMMTRLPRTSSGKVDRQRLLAEAIRTRS